MAGRTTTGQTGGITIRTEGFHELAAALRKTDRKAYLDYRKAMRGVGEIVASEARRTVESVSKTIPPTVKVRVAGAMVSVQGGSKDVPIGGLFELGNTGRARSAAVRLAGGTFRHPVFGDRTNWATQKMHPYLYRAQVTTEREWRPLLERVLTAAFEDSGIPVE